MTYTLFFKHEDGRIAELHDTNLEKLIKFKNKVLNSPWLGMRFGFIVDQNMLYIC